MKGKTISIVLFAILIFAACQGSEMQAGAEWLREPDLENSHNGKSLDIPGTDIYEVSASKIDIALMELEQTSITKLTPELAVWYTGHYYIEPEGKQPYLIMAVYGHAGTGAYALKRFDDNLLVIHQSLGHSTIYKNLRLS